MIIIGNLNKKIVFSLNTQNVLYFSSSSLMERNFKQELFYINSNEQKK